MSHNSLHLQSIIIYTAFSSRHASAWARQNFTLCVLKAAKINSLQLSILTAQPCVAENADLISASLAAVISYNNQL